LAPRNDDVEFRHCEEGVSPAKQSRGHAHGDCRSNNHALETMPQAATRIR
jgi:hypothetical protein